jgi:hypothetical protein
MEVGPGDTLCARLIHPRCRSGAPEGRERCAMRKDPLEFLGSATSAKRNPCEIRKERQNDREIESFLKVRIESFLK